MKKTATILTILGSLIFLLLFSQRMKWIDLPFGYVPTNHVRVDLYNQSSQKIKSVKLIYTSGQQNIGPIDINQKEIVTFGHNGEGTFQFTVIFESGKTLQDGEGYIEGGYHFKKYISDNEIRTVF